MSNKRIFMAGLGAGVMIGALLLQLVYASQVDIHIQTDERLYTEQEVAELIAAAQSSAAPNTAEPAEPAPSPTAVAEEPAPTSATPAEPDLSVNSPKPLSTPKQTSETFELRIYPGTSLTGTAELLVEHEVLGAKEVFIALMKKEDKSVRAGWFQFRKGMTAEEVIKVVTSQPLSKND